MRAEDQQHAAHFTEGGLTNPRIPFDLRSPRVGETVSLTTEVSCEVKVESQSYQISMIFVSLF